MDPSADPHALAQFIGLLAAQPQPDSSSASSAEDLYGPDAPPPAASGADAPPELGGAAPPPLADLSLALALADDPAAALACNDACRRPDVADGPGSDLWSADQVSAVLPRQYRFPVPTFAPRRWPAPAPLPQAEYSARFAREFPEVAALFPLPNVVVAGGAAAWPFGETGVKVGDVDLFVHGLDPADEGGLWRKVHEVVARLTALFLEGAPPRAAGASGPRGRAAAVTQMLSPGIVTLTAALPHQAGCGQEVKVQVILRAYPSVSAILHAFDVPAACVAYDGARAYTTTLGAYAQVFRTNLVVPAYRSTTFEARLAKYFDRGYALALPHLDPKLLRRGAALALPHLELAPAVARGYFAAGALRGLSPPGERHVSDYEPKHVYIRAIPEVAAYAPPHVNLRQLSSGEGRFVVTGAVTRRNSARALLARRIKEIPFARYARGGCGPAFADVFPRAAFDEALRQAATSVVRGGRVRTAALRRVFGLDDGQVAKFVLAVDRALSADPGRPLDVRPALAAFQQALVAKYEATPAAIGWWILADPGRQYTASLNPRMEDPAAWYGAAFNAAGAAPTSADYVESLLAALEARQSGVGELDPAPVYDGTCPLCHDPLTRGAANSVILPCGHIYHWAETGDGCSGLFDWVAHGNTDCPVCRHNFDPEEQDDVGPRPQVLNVEW